MMGDLNDIFVKCPGIPVITFLHSLLQFTLFISFIKIRLEPLGPLSASSFVSHPDTVFSYTCDWHLVNLVSTVIHKWVILFKKCTGMYWNFRTQKITLFAHILECTGICSVYGTWKKYIYLKMYWNVLEFHLPIPVATLCRFSLAPYCVSCMVFCALLFCNICYVFHVMWQKSHGCQVTCV